MSSSRRKLQLTASFGVLLLVALAVGCNGFFVDPILQSIQVGPSGQQILVGRTIQLTATGTYDQQGQQKDITGKAFWNSDANEVATVSAAGLVTGVGAGTATIDSPKGEVTGMQAISGGAKVYVVSGGELRIYNSSTGAEVLPPPVDIVGKAWDVKQVD